MTAEEYIQVINNQRVAILSTKGKEIVRTQSLSSFLLEKIQLPPHILEDINEYLQNKGLWYGTIPIVNEGDAQAIKACVSTIELQQQVYLHISVIELSSNEIDADLCTQKTLLNQLKLIIENSASVTTLYQIDGTPVYISAISNQIFGYTPEELMQKPSYYGIINEDKSAYFAYVNEIINGRNLPDGLDFRFTKKDGEVVWLNIKMNPVYDSGGHITHIQSGTRDINSSKLNELKLKKSEETARAIINSANASILLIDRNDIILGANDRAKVHALQIFGQSIAEGTNIRSISSLADSTIYQQGFNAAFKGEILRKYEKMTLINSDREIWFLMQFTPIWSNDGSINVISWSATDISEEKKAEEYTISLLQRLNLANSAGEIGIWEYDFTQKTAKFDDQCLHLFEGKIDVKASLANWAKHYKKENRLSLINVLKDYAKKEKVHFDLALGLNDDTLKVKFHRLKGIIFFKNNKPITATGVLIDITPSKVNEQYLQQSKNQLSLAQRLAKLGGFEIDMESQKFFWSENNYDIHQMSQNCAPTLRGYLKQIHSDDVAIFIKTLKTAIKTNHLQELVYRFNSENNFEITFNLRVKAVFFRNKLTKLIGTMQDITDHASLKKNLEHKEYQLNINQKRLSEYSFLNSHKVRAPLSNILGIIQLMRMELNAELVDMLERSAEDLDKVIHEANEILAV